MEKHRKDSIYERVQLDFGMNVFRRYYYCSGLLLDIKKEIKNKAQRGLYNISEIWSCCCVKSEGEITVYLLVRHNSGKCADFLHQGKVDCAFYFYRWPRVTGKF